jgi:pimeloyl-ACP methyl ester carboxylesterase
LRWLILTVVSDQQAPAKIHRIEVGGLTVAYRQAGSGPTLVLLHGALEDGRVWVRQLEDLSDEFTVIAVDAPGFGASDDPPPTWTTADYGNHLAEVLDAPGLDQPTVVSCGCRACRRRDPADTEPAPS